MDMNYATPGACVCGDLDRILDKAIAGGYVEKLMSDSPPLYQWYYQDELARRAYKKVQKESQVDQ